MGMAGSQPMEPIDCIWICVVFQAGTEIMQKLKSYLEALKREAEGRDEQMQSFWAESGRNIPFGLAAVHLDPLQSAKLDKLAWPFTQSQVYKRWSECGAQIALFIPIQFIVSQQSSVQVNIQIKSFITGSWLTWQIKEKGM